MSDDTNGILQSAEEFQRLVAKLRKEYPDMDKDTAERIVIRHGQKVITSLINALIDVDDQNSAHRKGLLDKIRKGK